MKHTHVDALTLVLDINYDIDDLKVLFWNHDSSFIFESNPKRDFNYKENLLLKYDNNFLGYFDFSLINRKYICHFRFSKFALYNSHIKVSNLLSFLSNKEFNARPKYFEIAVDNDSQSDYNKLIKTIKKSKLIMPENHNIFLGKEIYEENMYIPDSDATLYFRHKKKRKRDTYLRLENKTKVLKNKPEDSFILNYLKEKNLNTDRNIYRFELVFTCLESFRGARNSIYYSNLKKNKKPIFKSTINKYKKEIQKFEETENVFNFANPKIEKLRKIVDEYDVEGVTYKELKIDFEKLYDEDYLIALFQHSSREIVLNLYDIIDENLTENFIKPEKVIREIIKSKLSSKSQNVDYDERFLFLIYEKYDIRNYNDAVIFLRFLDSVMLDPGESLPKIIKDFRNYTNRK